MKTTLTFRAPYKDQYTGKRQTFIFEYKVPQNSLERIREDLTQNLKAKYYASKHTFTFKSRDDLYKGLERVAHWSAICR